MSRLSKTAIPKALAEIVGAISPFLWPPLDALRASAAFARSWTARGPWS
ncbi:hypothetical protein AKJ09_04588 [Labilithrix luteola]|uniref:Uncharacterized protein n=2 Tax=Labilithrix luteola TaxID=1391654 RepID=A0A0K1PXQ2_9BACT|nr:hypothetical protein AKJ09_04588 [Labilithrix luteola]